MKKILFLMLLCLPFIAMAQTDPKYLAGAITLDDGKVSFKTEIQAPSLTKDQLYETMLKWPKKYWMNSLTAASKADVTKSALKRYL